MSGLIAFLVVCALGFAVYLLGRSLKLHLARVPASFDVPDDAVPSPTVAPEARQ